MSRPLRIVDAGLTYHVNARGNGRMVIYRDDTDRTKFLDLLAEVVERLDVVCHAYCLMNTHAHAVITTQRANLPAAMRKLDGEYALWWNHRHGHVGHVFQGRYHAQVVQDDAYLLTCCNYVVWNPVRPGLVDSPDQWKWSSYRATAGLVPVPRFLSPELIWHYLGGGSEAPQRYLAFVAAARPRTCLPRLAVLGDDQFRQRFVTQRAGASLEVPARDRVVRPGLEYLFAGAVTRQARIQAIRRARSEGYLEREIAHYLGVHETTVSRLCGGMRLGQGRRVRGIQT
jgi:putative transposase